MALWSKATSLGLGGDAYVAAAFFLAFGLATFGAASTSGPRSTAVNRPAVKV